jgi:hypothetical protein
MDDRNDGLLRGSREGRIDQPLALAESPWSVDSLLGLHMALLDHAEEVRAAAMSALMEIAGKNPTPANVSPLDVLGRYMFSFTVASGVVPQVFRLLVKLGTPEAVALVKAVLANPNIRNDDFRQFVETALQSGNPDLIQHLKSIRCSAQKAKILNAALKQTH